MNQFKFFHILNRKVKGKETFFYSKMDLSKLKPSFEQQFGKRNKENHILFHSFQLQFNFEILIQQLS